MTKSTLKPGVVTGEGYKTLVEAAKKGGYALPAVNVTGTNTINAVMEAAAKAKLCELLAEQGLAPHAEFIVHHVNLRSLLNACSQGPVQMFAVCRKQVSN